MTTPKPKRTVLLSAHRGGCGRAPEVENTLAAFEAAVLMPIEYIEFDVQRTSDGVYLINHDDRVRDNGRFRYICDMTADEVDFHLGLRVRYEVVLALLAKAGRKAHLDLKFVSPQHMYSDPASTYEVDAVNIAREYLPDADIIVTTAEDRTVRAVRDWSDANNITIMVGLSIGRHRLTGMPLWSQIKWRIGEMWPEGRIHRSGANLVVAQRHLARVRLLSWAARHNLPVLVWTVDNHKEIRRLMEDARVWMVTSNYPERCVGLRDALIPPMNAAPAL